MSKWISILPLAVSLLLGQQAVSAGGCSTACYAQQQAQKARQLQIRRQQAQLAHKKAIAAQQARRKAAARKQAQIVQARANARRQAHGKRPAVQPQHRQPANRRLTPQQQAAALIALQQRAQLYNSVTNAYQNSMNNVAWRLRLQSATQSCQVAGNCRVYSRNYY